MVLQKGKLQEACTSCVRFTTCNTGNNKAQMLSSQPTVRFCKVVQRFDRSFNQIILA